MIPETETAAGRVSPAAVVLGRTTHAGLPSGPAILAGAVGLSLTNPMPATRRPTGLSDMET